MVGNLKTFLARSQVRNKKFDFDLQDLFACFERNKFKLLEGMTARNIGDVLLYLNGEHMDESKAWIRKAIEADTKNGTRWYLGTDYALYSDWFKKKGDFSRAKEKRIRAVEIFRQCGADGWVKKYEEELIPLS